MNTCLIFVSICLSICSISTDIPTSFYNDKTTKFITKKFSHEIIAYMLQVFSWNDYLCKPVNQYYSHYNNGEIKLKRRTQKIGWLVGWLVVA